MSENVPPDVVFTSRKVPRRGHVAVRIRWRDVIVQPSARSPHRPITRSVIPMRHIHEHPATGAKQPMKLPHRLHPRRMRENVADHVPEANDDIERPFQAGEFFNAQVNVVR